MKTKRVSDHYDAVAGTYSSQYDKSRLHTLSHYPGNYFRLQHLINAFMLKGVRRVLEVGVGEGTPLATLAGMGVDVWGFDLSQEMVKMSKKRMKAAKADPDHIMWGDIEDQTTYAPCLREGAFDGLMAMGVMPHVRKDVQSLKNMAACVKEGGTLFVEFRNKLFSLFTFNRPTVEFILDDLLEGVSPEVKDVVRKDLESRLRTDMPPVRSKVDGTDAPGYDAIVSKFHNPFDMQELFQAAGLKDVSFHWYHYHPAMPYLESGCGKSFREEAFRLESEPSGWKGLFLCSAFVVEATR